MKVSAYYAALSAMNDSDEPGVILMMRDGSQLYGIARNYGYGGGDGPPESSAWFSLSHAIFASTNSMSGKDADVLIDIDAVIAVIPQ